MNESFELHPGASKDITEIWQFIAEDNPVAATRFREDILHFIRKLVTFPTRVIGAPISPRGRSGFRRSAIILSLTRLMRSLSLSSP